MSLKKCIVLLLVLLLILSAVPLGAAAETVSPTESTDTVEEPAKKETGIPWAYTAFFLALITTFLQNKFIHGRR